MSSNFVIFWILVSSSKYCSVIDYAGYHFTTTQDCGSINFGHFFVFFFFSLPFYKGDKFCDLVCFPVHQVPFKKRSSLKGKTMLLREAKSCFSEWTPFSGARQKQF